MNSSDILKLFDALIDGSLSREEALERLKKGPFAQSSLGFAELDHHRALRLGFPEVVFGEGKSIDHLLTIATRLSEVKQPVLITRLNDEKISALSRNFPRARAHHVARTFLINSPDEKKITNGGLYLLVLAAGTSDFPVASEASEVCRAMGVAHEVICDVGVAGLHRLLSKLEFIQKASALVVIAGMEGALASVVGGLVDVPLFCVPTSVGYGAGQGGTAALMSMLNSCAPGVAVFNIDNGFSAAYAACRVVKKLEVERRGRK